MVEEFNNLISFNPKIRWDANNLIITVDNRKFFYKIVDEDLIADIGSSDQAKDKTERIQLEWCVQAEYKKWKDGIITKQQVKEAIKERQIAEAKEIENKEKDKE